VQEVEQNQSARTAELATRLPRPDEIFGNGVLIVPNLELAPETSHNANLGLTGDAPDTPSGSFRLDLNSFIRDTDELIVLLGNDRVFSYQNVYGARSLGVEAAIGWTSPGQHLAIDGNLTYQDIRNTSAEGSFGAFAGDRIPNRPWLLAGASARVQRRGLPSPGDEASLGYDLRYVHEFFRGWESLGQSSTKQVVASQLLHALVLTYVARGGAATVSSSLEVQNLTDARVHDFFGVQKPGRAIFFKGTIER